MANNEPTPLERTQLIEDELKAYVPGEPNHKQISWLEHHYVKINSELENDADIKRHLEALGGHLARLKHAKATKSLEAEKAAVESAATTNLLLQRVIAEKERE